MLSFVNNQFSIIVIKLIIVNFHEPMSLLQVLVLNHVQNFLVSGCFFYHNGNRSSMVIMIREDIN